LEFADLLIRMARSFFAKAGPPSLEARALFLTDALRQVEPLVQQWRLDLGATKAMIEADTAVSKYDYMAALEKMALAKSLFPDLPQIGLFEVELAKSVIQSVSSKTSLIEAALEEENFVFAREVLGKMRERLPMAPLQIHELERRIEFAFNRKSRRLRDEVKKTMKEQPINFDKLRSRIEKTEAHDSKSSATKELRKKVNEMFEAEETELRQFATNLFDLEPSKRNWSKLELAVSACEKFDNNEKAQGLRRRLNEERKANVDVTLNRALELIRLFSEGASINNRPTKEEVQEAISRFAQIGDAQEAKEIYIRWNEILKGEPASPPVADPPLPNEPPPGDDSATH
jgi:hypothetical protein